MDRIGAAFLMLILVFAGRWSSYSLFRCRHDSIARRTCCCPKVNHESGAPAGGVIAVSDCCCDIETVTIAPPDSEAARSDASDALVSVAPVVFLSSLRDLVRSDPDLLSVAGQPSGAGPPAILLKRSLQI